MGGGTRWAVDTPKVPPRTFITSAGDGDLSGDSPTAPVSGTLCTLPQDVPISLEVDDPPSAGARVTLVLGNPPPVLVGNRQVGVVCGHAAIAMRGCLEAGYEMTGTIEKVDPVDRSAVARIRGRRTEAA
jgi:hypothetical protein